MVMVHARASRSWSHRMKRFQISFEAFRGRLLGSSGRIARLHRCAKTSSVWQYLSLRSTVIPSSAVRSYPAKCSVAVATSCTSPSSKRI